jgi:HSP20 family protein
MADTNPKQAGKESGQSLARRENRGMSRWESAPSDPFEFMDRMSNEMDRWFDRVARDFGFPRRSWLSSGLFSSPTREAMWTPRIEAFQQGDRFIVRADLPGLKKDDVDVELTGDALTIRGERREEHEQEREGMYHSERQYGQFYRTIPLPEGVITENAQAVFRDGVLEVSMPAPPAEANRGRKLEIKEGEQQEKK